MEDFEISQSSEPTNECAGATVGLNKQKAFEEDVEFEDAVGALTDLDHEGDDYFSADEDEEIIEEALVATVEEQQNETASLLNEFLARQRMYVKCLYLK